MRGSQFFHGSRLGVRESDRNFLIHKQMLNRIKTRHKSKMSKCHTLKLIAKYEIVVEAQGVEVVAVRSSDSYKPRTSVSGSRQFKNPSLDYSQQNKMRVTTEDDSVVIGDNRDSKVSGSLQPKEN